MASNLFFPATHNVVSSALRVPAPQRLLQSLVTIWHIRVQVVPQEVELRNGLLSPEFYTCCVLVAVAQANRHGLMDAKVAFAVHGG